MCVCLAGITKRNQYRRLFTLTGGRQTIVLRHSSIEIQKPHLGPQGIPETLDGNKCLPGITKRNDRVPGGNHEAKSMVGVVVLAGPCSQGMLDPNILENLPGLAPRVF